MATWTALYIDGKNEVWSCAVTKAEQGYVLATTNGARPITFYIPEPSASGGFLAFHNYRLDDAPPGLRACDFIALTNEMYKTLPWPQRPAQSPTPAAVEEDPRLRVAPGATWAEQKQAFYEQQIVEQQRARSKGRIELQNVPPDPRAVASARQNNNYAAAIRRPKR
jgi:hypothetical protein